MQPVRFLSALALAALVIVGLAACSSGQAPGWTYAPPPSPSAAASTAPSAGASAVASAAPSGAASAAPSSATPSSAPASTEPSLAPSAAPSAAASGGTGGTGGTTVIPEGAQNIQFTNLALAAPAGQPFQIAFDNQDASIPHNIQIMDGSGATVFDGEIVTGVAQATYNVNALAAGTYKFICKIHPNVMIGALTVQ